MALGMAWVSRQIALKGTGSALPVYTTTAGAVVLIVKVRPVPGCASVHWFVWFCSNIKGWFMPVGISLKVSFIYFSWVKL